MYGDAVYTTLKARSSRSVFFDAHIKRLRDNTSRLKFGEMADIADIATVVKKIISLNKISLGYVRITIPRGIKLEFPALHASAFSILVIAGSTDFLSSCSALSVITVPEGRNQFRDVKTSNRLVALDALAYAWEQNAQEAICTDHQQLIEATCSNLIESRGVDCSRLRWIKRGSRALHAKF